MDRAAKTIALFLLLAGAGVFVWASDKGFDFTDEGLYALVYQHPQEFPDSYTSYHRVGAIVFDGMGQNLVALRLLGFALTALATFYFGKALIAFLGSLGVPLLLKRADQLALHFALQGSVLAAYSWLPPTPNYNTMAGIGMLLSCGGVLAFFTKPDPLKISWGPITGLLTMVCGLFLAFLAKGSSAVGIILLGAVLLGLCRFIGMRKKILLVVLSIASVLFGGVCLFLLMPGLLGNLDFFFGSIVALGQGDGASGIIARHWQEALNFAFRHLFLYTLPVLFAVGTGVFARLPLLDKTPERKAAILFLAVVAVLVAEVVLAVVREAFLAGIGGRSKSMFGYTSFFFVLVVLRVGLPGFAKTLAPIRGVDFLIFLAWLALLPFATAAGTTHKIYINALLHAAPLSAASILLATSLDKSLRRNLVLPFACLFLVGLGFAQFFSGFVVSPYRTSPKWTQTVPVEVGLPSTVLKLDPASAQCIETTKAALREAGFRPGDDILALYGLPGLVYAVGGVSPQRPWFFNDHGPSGDTENLLALKKIPIARIQSCFILQTDGDARIASQLGECGVNFPETFKKTGASKLPYKNRLVEVWKPMTSNPQMEKD